MYYNRLYPQFAITHPNSIRVSAMPKTANEIQKERTREIEEKAVQLLEQCPVVTLASVNENGYPRICTVSKLKANGFSEIYFETSKRSPYHGKAVHFQNNPKASVGYSLGGDSVTLIGNVEIVQDMEEKKAFAQQCNPQFFKKGVEDPRHVLLRFRVIEATFWIEGKFRTCRYKE
ncbi:MAG: general stress protein [Chloroflexi bacterium]|nr:MAG: general stress protein [Chloroflexota bacterium]